MHVASEPVSHQCADCGARIELMERPVEGLLARSGRPSHRVMTVAGVEVHRCVSPFLTMAQPFLTIVVDASTAWKCIDRASVILSAQIGCSPAHALFLISRRAHYQGVLVEDVAAGIVARELIV